MLPGMDLNAELVRTLMVAGSAVIAGAVVLVVVVSMLFGRRP